MPRPLEQAGMTSFVIPAQAGIQMRAERSKGLDARQSLSRTRCGAGMTVKS
jgi:hypothetical protein